MAVYLGQSVHREPLDQTDLKDGVGATLEVVENRHSKEGLIDGPRGSSGL